MSANNGIYTDISIITDNLQKVIKNFLQRFIFALYQAMLCPVVFAGIFLFTVTVRFKDQYTELGIFLNFSNINAVDTIRVMLETL